MWTICSSCTQFAQSLGQPREICIHLFAHTLYVVLHVCGLVPFNNVSAQAFVHLLHPTNELLIVAVAERRFLVIQIGQKQTVGLDVLCDVFVRLACCRCEPISAISKSRSFTYHHDNVDW